MNFDTTVGGATATSYASLAEAEAYFEGNAPTGWDALDDAAKEQKLIAATNQLEIKYRGHWIGQKATSTQRLAWPRAVKVDSGTPLTDPDGVTIPVDAIPEPIKTAQLEVVRINASGGSFITQPTSKDQFVKRKKIDVLETEWFDGAPSQTTYPYLDQILYGYASGAQSGVPTVQFNLLLTEREANQGANAEDVLNDPRYFIQG